MKIKNGKEYFDMLELTAKIVEKWPDWKTGNRQKSDDWKCPECGDGPLPKPDLRCNCREPLAISIPAGQHIHLRCPVHGDRKIYGNLITY